MDVIKDFKSKCLQLRKYGRYYLGFITPGYWEIEKSRLHDLGFKNVYYSFLDEKVHWEDFEKDNKDEDVDYSELVVILRRYKFSNMCLESDISYIDSLIKRFGGCEK